MNRDLMIFIQKIENILKAAKKCCRSIIEIQKKDMAKALKQCILTKTFPSEVTNHMLEEHPNLLTTQIF